MYVRQQLALFIEVLIMRKKEDNSTQYMLATYIKDTGQENGPGHVSASIIKQRSGTPSKIRHTSFYPDSFASILNALSLGSIPVVGRLADSHLEDLSEADHVLIKPISRDEYKRGLRGQSEFSSDVNRGQRFYSVFGSNNPLALVLSRYMSHMRNAELTAKNYKSRYGHTPPEDNTGIAVFDNTMHVSSRNIEPDNCASSVTHVLKHAGVNFNNPEIPTLFKPELEKKGFETISKDDLKSKFGLE